MTIDKLLDVIVASRWMGSEASSTRDYKVTHIDELADNPRWANFVKRGGETHSFSIKNIQINDASIVLRDDAKILFTVQNTPENRNEITLVSNEIDGIVYASSLLLLEVRGSSINFKIRKYTTEQFNGSRLTITSSDIKYSALLQLRE